MKRKRNPKCLGPVSNHMKNYILWKEHGPATPSFQTSTLQNCERINVSVYGTLFRRPQETDTAVDGSITLLFRFLFYPDQLECLLSS